MITLSAKKTLLTLILIAIALTFLSVAGHAVQYFLGVDHLSGYVRLFNISGEANIPTWFDSVALLFCSILLAAIAYTKKINRDRYAFHWMVLSILLLCVSLDETAQIHEMLNEPLRLLLNTRGLLYFASVIPGALLVFVAAIAYLGFFFELPATSRRLFLVSGVIYVGGALGIEMVGGFIFDYHPDQILIRGGLATLEDLAQMLGEVVFIYALLSYIGSHMKDLQIHIIDGADEV